MVKKTLLCVSLMMFATVMFAAQKPVTAHTDVRIAGKVQVDNDTPQSTLFSNLGPAGNQYNAGNGYFVTGAGSPTLGQSQFMSLPITSASVVAKVIIPVQYYGDGSDNYVQICIYKDAAGLPGTQLKCKNKTGLPAFGTTNAPTTVQFNYTIPGGSQPIWIVAQEPASGTGSNATMVWDAHISNEAGNVAGGGWFAFGPDTEGALKVTGTP